MLLVGGRSNRQDIADRLDPMGAAIIIDKRDHRLNGRSSSACAKYADALRRISLASRPTKLSAKHGQMSHTTSLQIQPTKSRDQTSNASLEVIRLALLMYVRFPLSLENIECLPFERGIDICLETGSFWWNRFGPMFASGICRQRVSRMRGIRHWQWHPQRDVLEAQRGAALPLARGRPRRRSSRELCPEEAQ